MVLILFHSKTELLVELVKFVESEHTHQYGFFLFDRRVPLLSRSIHGIDVGVWIQICAVYVRLLSKVQMIY